MIQEGLIYLGLFFVVALAVYANGARKDLQAARARAEDAEEAAEAARLSAHESRRQAEEFKLQAQRLRWTIYPPRGPETKEEMRVSAIGDAAMLEAYRMRLTPGHRARQRTLDAMTAEDRDHFLGEERRAAEHTFRSEETDQASRYPLRAQG